MTPFLAGMITLLLALTHAFAYYLGRVEVHFENMQERITEAQESVHEARAILSEKEVPQ